MMADELGTKDKIITLKNDKIIADKEQVFLFSLKAIK